MFEESENGAVSDTCDDCGETIWYDPEDDSGVYCDTDDLSVEHECDPDEEDEEE